uniref:NF-kappa-B inhibitor zeta-like n=1 Tax=Echeneis naucrates TaxID=173247 RepID=A0A665VQI7_ECHNA
MRNIRLAQGWEPQDFQVNVKMKNIFVNMRMFRIIYGLKHRSHLEELEIIIEVLEEDLRTCNTSRSPSQKLSCYDPPVSPEWSPAGRLHFHTVTVKDEHASESDDMIPSPQSYRSYSPGGAECYKALSPPGFTSPQPGSVYGSGGEEWVDPPNHDWNLNDSMFFWTQLQREESQLRDVSDAMLLATDELRRTFTVYTALLHAANHNHHLMVADLIRLGANVNATNNSGKSCLHLSAEKGYVRVLEVLKQTMMDGVYVDVEATDNCGMSVLQCASLALKATVCELEGSKSPNPTRLHVLRQEQMMETLECLLHMVCLSRSPMRYPLRYRAFVVM